MLNYNKIHSSINFDRTSKRKIAEFIGIAPSTFRSRLDMENLTPNDIEKIAEYFNKPIAYFFDKEEGTYSTEAKVKKVEEGQTKFNVKDICKQKDEIIAAQKKTIETLERYIAALEQPGQSRRNGTSG